MSNKVQPILSIIVPSYNTSQYVDECLPTYIDDRLIGKIKVLCIDDGATDNTKEKIMPYVEKYPTLFYFYHKENGGHGSVINYGVHQVVDTKYFKVIDGDDWVDTEALVNLVEYLYQCDDDLVVSRFNYVWPDKTTQIDCIDSKNNKDNKFKEKNTYSTEILPLLCIRLHSATFKTATFKDNNIVIPEKIFYEDNLYYMYPLKFIKKCSYINQNVYQYRLGVATQSTSKEQPKGKHYNDSIAVKYTLIEFYEKEINGFDDKNIVIAFEKNVHIGLRSVFYTFDSNKRVRQELLQIDKAIKPYKSLRKALKNRDKFNRLLFFCHFHFLFFFRKFA